MPDMRLLIKIKGSRNEMKTVLIILSGILICLLLMAVRCLDVVYYFRREEKKRNLDLTEEEQKRNEK